MVELTLPAVIPGFLVALHYLVQITRPNWGFRSDIGGNRTTWIIGGLTVLSFASVLAAVSIKLFEFNFYLGLTLSIFAYFFIGLGVGAAGTSLLALLATYTEPGRRAAAATITWLMMIFGIAITAIIIGSLIDPYSALRLIKITVTLGIICTVVSALTLWGIEQKFQTIQLKQIKDNTSFQDGLKQIWSEKNSRTFTFFVFLSMIAYFMQELILEPYAGLVFNFSVGESTTLSGIQNSGVLFGMIFVGLSVSGFKLGSLRFWVQLGCIGSAFALIILAILGTDVFQFTELAILQRNLKITVTILGVFNGVFAVGAIGSMMQLAGIGFKNREGTRMGLWGAAQAIAAAFGTFIGTMGVDIMRALLNSNSQAFGVVFAVEATLFLAAAIVSFKVVFNDNKTDLNITD